MANRDRALLIDSLGTNWAVTSTSNGSAAAGTTAAASVSGSVSTERIHMTQLGWSIRNNGAAAFTATLNVAHASGTTVPTVIGSWDVVPAAAGSAQDSWFVNYLGKKGKGLQAYFAAPATSVVQKVSIAGWRDTLSDG